MLSNSEFVRQSLELNLFFMRIAKEHAIFLKSGLMQKNNNIAFQAEMLKNEFSQLLVEAIRLSEGIISPEVASSGELITDLTLDSERQAQYYTGISIDSKITVMEANLIGSDRGRQFALFDIVRHVTELNHRAMAATNRIISFKSSLLRDVLSCGVFSFNYPLLIDHVLREAHFYLRALTVLQNRHELDLTREAVNQELFWNKIMAEHAKFIRGLLDPTEVNLFNTANNFGMKFDELTVEAQKLAADTGLLPSTTQKTLEAVKGIRDFKRQGTEGLVQCKIRAIVYALLGDHVVREANHYIRLLKTFKRTSSV
ncbi:DUF2935 domain-containing protein [Clostridiaceae bacterium UIB06]|uniref:DUF2935 domain-containing protein n=1 Tax=Clostridium thailandense TaxID=2794346 RepID=A0A949U271_9CLOT|nr:DUF2935 domain-containing protein [Clostridium thailandense]MBV7276031.1 DUF2935 domain-containing protein [Clostridium thailandense]MCH5137010.1 DUF2935 domain-containing protein [Clostridiaceae bacterium UIB06]